ncbi:MAG: Ldh family oxidoreductase [Candidatus Rokubacteria bacterium]|nr:Ldh family oxidoreductase [Candidatus Rokubacteria bacterium]
MAEASTSIRHERLHAFIVECLVAMTMARRAAETTAGLMVRTDLRGVESHGIDMLPRYWELWRDGVIAMDAEPLVLRDDGATALLDGRKGLGHPVSARAMQLAIDKARTFGIGIAAVKHSNHFGAAANYSMMALAHDLIGVATTNTPYVAMVPTFGRAAKLGTNPISFAAPAGDEPPFVLDMATTTVAFGKIRVASRWEKPIPEGWAVDERGISTTDPFVALKARLLTPVGGSRETGGHKGYGLAVMVDILSGVLGGAVYGDLYYRSDMPERKLGNVGHCFAAIDPARFREIDEFKRDMDDMIRSLKATPPAEGQTRVLVAGEPEAAAEQTRRANGIPISPGLAAQIARVADDLGVPHLR